VLVENLFQNTASSLSGVVTPPLGEPPGPCPPPALEPITVKILLVVVRAVEKWKKSPFRKY
jgi:hypothetical protein